MAIWSACQSQGRGSRSHAMATTHLGRLNGAMPLEAIGLAGAPGLTDVQYWISQATGLDIVEPPDQEKPLSVVT